MKKLISLFTAMLLTIVSFAADVTVYFHNTEGWTSVYAYAWSPQNAAWPGEKMSPTNMENYFAYVLTGDQKNIIFTNGNGTQTQNLTVEAGRCFEWVNGTTTTSWTDAPEGIQIGESGPVVTETIDVTVRVYTEEAAPKIWWWGGGIAGSDATYEWDARPSMNKEGETNWYAWTFEGVNKDLGISYKITATNEREFANVMVDNCYDANLDLLDCNYTPSAQDTTITNPTDTTTKDTTIVEPVVNYYMKHSWAGGDWTWKQLAREAETDNYLIRDIYGATGCNWNTKGENDGATWVANPTLVGEPAKGDSAIFVLNNGEITITKIIAPVDTTITNPTDTTTQDTTIVPVVKEYTIVGDAALFGEAWNIKSTATNMTTEDNIHYTYTIDSVALEAKTYEYKVVEGHSWAGWQLPASGNQQLAIAEAGAYRIAFAMNVEEYTLTAEATKLIAPVDTTITNPTDTTTQDTTIVPVVKEYTIVGDAALFGKAWDIESTATNMTTEDNIHYTYTIDSVALEAKTYEYKVVEGHSWAGWQLPASGNQKLAIAEAGAYRIAFAMNVEEYTLTAEATKLIAPVDTTITNPTDTTTQDTTIVPVVKEYTIVGDAALFGKAWDIESTATNMTTEDNIHYTYTIDSVALEAKTYEYKVVEGHSWAGWQLPASGNQQLAIAEAGAYRIAFAMNVEEYTITAEATKLIAPVDTTITNPTDTTTQDTTIVPVVKEYTIVGDAALFGKAWDIESTATNMTTEDNIHYTYTIDSVALEAKTYEYKVVEGHSWAGWQLPASGNQKLAIAEAGAYRIAFAMNVEEYTLTAEATKLIAPVDTTITNPTDTTTQDTTIVPVVKEYTIVGDAALFGKAWDIESTATNMTTEDNIHYTYTIDSVALEAKTYEYKVVEGHSWAGWQLPASGNQELAIAEAGAYRIAFAMNVEEYTLTAEATKLIAPVDTTITNPTDTTTQDTTIVPVVKEYTIVGEAALFGKAWDIESTATNMTTEDNIHYTYTIDSVALEAKTYEYKVVEGHSWAGWQLPASGNQQLAIAEAGAYRIAFAMNVEEYTLTAEATKLIAPVDTTITNPTDTTTQDTTIVPVVKEYTIVGEAALFGKAWDIESTATNMTTEDNIHYTYTIDSVALEAKTYEYKVVEGHSWAGWQLPASGNQQLAIAEAGAYRIAFAMNVEEYTLTAEAIKLVVNPTDTTTQDTTIIDPNMPTEGFGILIYGEEHHTGIAGVLNEAQKDWTEYAITGVELEAGAQFQIYDFTHKGGWVEKLDAASTEHVTAGDYWYIVDAKGTYDIYLKMFGYNDNQVYIGYTAPTTTDIEAIQSSNTAAKVMIDGHIYIIRGGKVFNINGQLMK